MTVAAIVLATLPATSGAVVSDIFETGDFGEYLKVSYPVKYMTFAGIDISNVGDNPRYKLGKPSYRAILTSPSQVPLKLRLAVDSTRHDSAVFASDEEPGTVEPIVG